MPTIAGLFVYPLKSARGIALPSVHVTRLGPDGDRRWMVIDPDGRMVTQRKVAELACVGAFLTDTGLRLVMGTEQAEVNHPAAGERVTVSIWKDAAEALVSPSGSAWLSDRLGRPVRLAWLPEPPESNARRCDPRYAAPGDLVGFADGFPLLVTTTGALDALNQRLDEPVTMDRFRPNLVIDDPAPFAEDGWRTLNVGEVELEIVKPCERCRVTTIDQHSGVARGPEPLATLARIHRDAEGRVIFGQNAVVRRGGWLALGAEVRVRCVP